MSPASGALGLLPPENKLRKRRHVGSGCAIARHSAARPPSFSAIFRSAPWWWWRRDRWTLSRECATMIVIGLIVSAFGIGFLCWLMFTLAVHALPFFAGITVG